MDCILAFVGVKITWIFRVIVCPAFGFNSTKGKEIGYPWPIEVLSGGIRGNTDSISWNSILNLSWQQVQDSLFTDFETLRERFYFYQISKDNVQEVDLLPFMNCLEVKNYPKLLQISSKLALNVFLTDAMRQTYYRNCN